MTDSYDAEGQGESGLRRLVAPNPSPMTETGTNSYVLGTTDLAVIDPGPDDAAHLAALERAVAGRPVRAVIVTHSHLDHSPGAAPLADKLDAPVLAFGPSEAGRSAVMRGLDGLVGGGEGVDAGFRPDERLADGALVTGEGWTLEALHTPGHMANHLSLHWRERNETFTGDTVMGWASTLISPPDGDLGQFMASLDRLEALEARRFHPGHGAPIDASSARCRALRTHRLGREAAVLAALSRPQRIADLVPQIYADTPPPLHGAAARNLLAHLVHLEQTGRVAAAPDIHPDALWQRL
ncbi:MBL fold metallo-hydrolase [Jannaschia seohaensis]|uniref:Glyoxylase, beta-lactamase superfamily II n=1 Tax=Jannaschia seohaensis TaxID=475081 RepID=A0A2Y9B4Q7_9RHOB|nr:MBL fold metallo-hydrolase [Jannaschia seohaensis]PWJ10903.1 glyoxylase-like metal-dependent hydrolase (beta-lactamase superfamily II) [Jannaschia seohaensis]SSA51504.1 Glyoxylase, beta-lactamase superfamily II [Jannaschia seohaensis]